METFRVDAETWKNYEVVTKQYKSMPTAEQLSDFLEEAHDWYRRLVSVVPYGDGRYMAYFEQRYTFKEPKSGMW